MEVDSSEKNVSSEETQKSGSIFEGKVEILHDPQNQIFYNPTQEVNRDISIVGIQTFIRKQAESPKPKSEKHPVSILEAMAASGIRSIRYAKEISGVQNIIANDFSQSAVDSIKRNSEHNKATEIIEPSFMDASALMHSQKYKHMIVDIDPYGTPVPFLDAAVQCVQDGGMLLVTATDMALLAGNHPESCFAKYGSVSLKSKACHEIALRIVIFTVQTIANRYGRYVEPLLSLKIDFYVRIFFRVKKSAIKCKETAAQTSMVYQCTGCRSLNLQPLSIKRSNGCFGFAHAPTVSPVCEFCDSCFHIGGPIWSGQIHDKGFIADMLDTLNTTHNYVNTSPRIQGLLNVAGEEVDVPLLYEISQLCSTVKCSVVPLLQLRSALISLGYEVSESHVGPNTLKTNAPNKVLWDVLREWHRLGHGGNLKSGTPGFNLVEKGIKTEGISFDVREDANPPSRESRFLRFQMNPTKYWGPGVRNNFKVSDSGPDKRLRNQGKHGKRKHQPLAAEVSKPGELIENAKQLEEFDSPETKNSKCSN